MIVIKYLFLLLNLFQLIRIESFWQESFLWFFIWTITCNIQWFFVDNPIYKRILLHMLSLLTLINLFILPSFPILMIAIHLMDTRQQYSRRYTIIYTGLFVTLAILISLLFNYPVPLSLDNMLLTIAVSFIGILAVEQHSKISTIQSQLYDKSRQLDEQTENLQSLRAQMIAMEEVNTLNERNRISRDLHDSVGHTLSTIAIQLAAIQKLTEKTAPQASDMLKELHQFTREGLDNVRKVIHEMKPKQYQKVAFIDQLQSIIQVFEKNSQIMVYFNYNNLLWDLSVQQEQMIFRAVQEFLGNTTKHTQATEVRILFHFTDDSLILTMKDNGQGTGTIKPQLGILGMQERAKLLSGRVQVQSAINQGFKIRIVLPKGGYVDDRRND